MEGTMTWISARWIVILGSLVVFLIAAKSHGRQIRVERELAGHFSVSFGTKNHPFVEALWQRERVVYWSLAALFALLSVAYLVLAPGLGWPLPSLGGWALPVAALWAMTSAFVLSGLLTFGRLVVAKLAPAEVLLGSAGWWALTIALLAALLSFALRLQPAASAA
jgi:hypothetical protein